MQGSTCYSICSNRLTPEDDEFANLYAFLTGQNRTMELSLGNNITTVEQANFILVLLGGDTTPIESVRSHNQMFMQLASKLMAEWEALGRVLNVSEPDIYAIKADNIHSVKEQAVQMFQHWMRKNGSRATLGVLTTAVYDSGPQYWNLLDTINKYAPQQ